MIAVKLTEKIMAEMPEYCDECPYFDTRPHPYKGWIYDGNGRPKNCPLIEVEG